MADDAGISRRLLLACAGVAAGTAALSSCGTSGKTDDALVPSDRQIRREAMLAELRLIATYEATAAARPDLAELCGQFIDQHRAHADTLAAGETLPAAPAAQQASLEQLTDLEQQAAGERAGASVRAGDEQLAALLCWIGTSEAQHAAVLAGQT